MAKTNEQGTMGILGGMGPLATAVFFEIVVQRTVAGADQEHPDIIIYNMASIPDRTGFIFGKTAENPGQHLNKHVKSLWAQGVKTIAIPCCTATYFYDQATDGTDADVINTIDAVSERLVKMGAKKVGLMATDGTIKTGLFKNGLGKYGIEVVVPDEAHQKLVMKTIYEHVKAGIPADMDEFNSVAKYLLDQGCDAIILGCTELSIVNKEEKLDPKIFVDSLVVLAETAIERCGYEVKA